jgi:methyl-accepting chemotaxis protein
LDTKLIAESFARMSANGEELTRDFYKRLFHHAPGVRPMFSEDTEEQSMRLLSTLNLVVKSLDRPEELTGPLLAIGARHNKYGATAEHYPVVIDTMIETLANQMGAEWTSAIEQAWRDLLNHAAELMIKGAEDAASSTSAA